MKVAQSPSAKIDRVVPDEQVPLYHNLASTILDLQAALVERSGRAHACCPDLQRRRDSFTAVEQESVCVGGHDAHTRTHVHAERAKLRDDRSGDRVGERSQDARRALEKRHAQPTADIDFAIARRQLDHAGQLGGQFDAGRATADDGDVDGSILKHAARYMGTQSRIECVSLVLAVDEVTMLGNPWCPEIVRTTAERQDEHVVLQLTRIGDRFASTLHRRKTHALNCPVVHRAVPERIRSDGLVHGAGTGPAADGHSGSAANVWHRFTWVQLRSTNVTRPRMRATRSPSAWPAATRQRRHRQ